ncbi:MAG TPA: T9SS type A sorting domain-containing protein, partial [Parafilimonas sp.]|nr:T9SS type A sorting domain-containing protein [Parafilimonas sp.]
WSFDALTGALIIADVGQSTWEEVDRQKAGSHGGQNYGWRCYEGNHPFNTAGCKPQSAYTSPVFEYQHLNGDCSITGGFVYRGGQYPKLYGKYFCADYCSGFIRAVSIYASTVTAQTVYDGPANAYTAFGEDIHRELYVTDLTRGLIYRVTDSSAAPNIAGQYVPEFFNIVPNPAKGNFNIVYQSATSQQVQVRVENLVGQQFYAGTKSASPGKNIWRINIDLPAGNYYVTLTDHYGRVINQQLIIR